MYHPYRMRLVLVVVGLIIGGIMAGCQSQQASAPLVLTVYMTDTITPSPTPTEVSATPKPMEICYMNWAYDNAPASDVQAIREALDTAGYPDILLDISAYGEDYVCSVEDVIVSSEFLLMDISPTITYNDTFLNLDDQATVGGIVRDMLVALVDLSDISRLNQIEIIFVSGDDTRQWRASYNQIMPLMAEGDVVDFYELGLSP